MERLSIPLSRNYSSVYFAKSDTPVPPKALSYNEKGKKFSRKGDFDKAVAEFKKALEIYPNFSEAQMELAKTYKLKEDYPKAINEFDKYLKLEKNDSEAAVLLGDCYRQQGYYGKAIDIFGGVASKEPDNDYAQRLLKETQNQFYSIFNPEKGLKQLNKVKQDTINQAVSMAKEFLPQGFTNSLNDLDIKFDETQRLAGYANIAQYEHAKRKVAVSEEYTWANPKLVAAYLVHEFVHAKDNDAYTSVKEEQDAFRTQAQYWQKNGGNISDPEMDYILQLYKEAPEKLDDRVKEIYMLRDPRIPMTSPNHPPVGLNRGVQASQALIKYDAIA